MRRILRLRAHITAPGLDQDEITRDMVEALSVQEDGRNAFLRRGPREANPECYKTLLDATLEIYNRGATRLNGGEYREEPWQVELPR